MREIVTTVRVYPYAELSPKAQARALEDIQSRMLGGWWDQNDIDDIGEVMRHQLAEDFRSPEWDLNGVTDGVTIAEWDLDRGQYLVVAGTLTRANAPALPWVVGVDFIALTAGRYGTDIEVVDVEIECTCVDDSWTSPHEAGCNVRADSPVTDDHRRALKAAVVDALHKAWKAGEAEMEYKGSEENALQYIEGNEREFTEDGKLYTR